jgi:hypothetical protein
VYLLLFLHLLLFHGMLFIYLLGQLVATAPTRAKHDDISLNVLAFGQVIRTLLAISPAPLVKTYTLIGFAVCTRARQLTSHLSTDHERSYCRQIFIAI